MSTSFVKLKLPYTYSLVTLIIRRIFQMMRETPNFYAKSTTYLKIVALNLIGMKMGRRGSTSL